MAWGFPGALLGAVASWLDIASAGESSDFAGVGSAAGAGDGLVATTGVPAVAGLAAGLLGSGL
jgi:hypothetical protein